MPRRSMLRPALAIAIAAVPAAILPVAASAQQQGSMGFLFLKAVREGDGQKATEILNQNSTVVNYRGAKGEAALHIVTRDRNLDWMAFLVGRDANVNVEDDEGNTALMLASMLKFYEGAEFLIKYGAKVDQANSRGETPLIRAVQLRDGQMVKLLIDSGADPAKRDSIAGMSARDYANRDGRNSAISNLLDKAKPKAAKGKVYGPQL